MKPEIAFFDIDGTLIDFSSKRMSSKTEDALLILQSNGCKIVAATGRAPFTLPDFGSVQFDGMIFYNGSSAYVGKERIYSKGIDHNEVAKVLENARRLDTAVLVSTENARYYHIYNTNLRRYLEFSKFDSEKLDESRIPEMDIFQMTAVSDEDVFDRLLTGTSALRAVRWCESAADIILRENGKESAMKEMLAHFNIPQDKTVAFGDGHNDIDMLRYAQIGIAMGNSHRDVAEIADYVTRDCKSDGVYHALVKFGWI